MAKVTLDFIPPEDNDIIALHIYESASKTGPFVEIERTTVVGTSPYYITKYTSNLAASSIDWFTIAWENAAGDVGTMSQPWKGGTESLVQKIIDRVRERDASLDERAVAQEAEGAIQLFLGNDVDPYDSTLSVTYRQLNGLTYLVMARAITVNAITSSSGSIASATLGLVSFKSESGSSRTVDVQALIDIANMELGIGTSFILQLESIEQEPYIVYDHSRLVSGWLSIEP